MIKEIANKPPQKYGRYFLSIEAPGDEEELVEQPPVKRNTKIIDVKPNNRKKLDFTDGAEEPLEEETPEESEEQQDLDINTDNQDYNQDDETQEVEPDVETEPTVSDPESDAQEDPNANTTPGETDQNTQNPDQTEPTVTGDNVADPNTDGTTEINTDDPNGDPNEPDVSGDENFNDGADVPPEDGTEDAQGDAKKGPGLEYDSTRKYNLFQNYISLTNAVNNYISKLENNMGENYIENQIIKTSTEKLREIYDLAYDYMTMKFEISSYVQSLLFFQNLVIMVQMVFDLLGKMKKNEKKGKVQVKH